MSTAFQRTMATALLVSITACTTVRPVPEPRQYITARAPRMVWLTRSAPAGTIALEGPRILGDTLIGFVDGRYTEMHLSQVTQVRARQPSRGKTLAFAVGLGLAVVGLTFVISGGAGGGDEYEEEGFRFRPRR